MRTALTCPNISRHRHNQHKLFLTRFLSPLHFGINQHKLFLTRFLSPRIRHCMMMYLSVILVILTIIIRQLRTQLHLHYSISGTPRFVVQDVSHHLIHYWLIPELNKSQITNFSQQCDVWKVKAKVLLLRVRPGFSQKDTTRLRHGSSSITR